jgi:hypothetical protein
MDIIETKPVRAARKPRTATFIEDITGMPLWVVLHDISAVRPLPTRR